MTESRPASGALPPITLGLIAASGLVALWSALGARMESLPPLLIATPGVPGLQEVLRGEVWRLFTPAFIHFGLMHLAFNMLWLWDLGRTIEVRRGPVLYLALVLVVAAASNFAQYALTGSPWFGGMSGVVYGLLGYAWIQGRLQPHVGVQLHNATAAMMAIWYVLCWTGLLGPVANWAHSAGLALGIAWGFLHRTPMR